jgi:MFS family permease
LADKFERRKWLISMQIVQLVFSCALALLALGTPAVWMLFLAALGVGIGNAMNAPAWSAMLPSLVRPEDLSGALALNSTVINGSRVIGPIIVAIFSQWGATTAQFFFANAATYLFVIVALLSVNIPTFIPDPTKGWRRFTRGLAIARHRPTVRRLLITLATFSFSHCHTLGSFLQLRVLTLVSPKTAALTSGCMPHGVLARRLVGLLLEPHSPKAINDASSNTASQVLRCRCCVLHYRVRRYPHLSSDSFLDLPISLRQPQWSL